MLRTLYLALAALALLGGCMARDAGFRDVSQLVRERVGATVRWRPGQPDRGALDSEVREMLAAPLTAPAAVRIALLNNRELAAAFEEIGFAQGALLGASLLPNPRVSGDVRPWAVPNTPGFSPHFDLTATIDVTRILMLPVRRGIAVALFEAAKLRAAGRAIDLAYGAEVAFYRYQSAAQTIELARTVAAATAASAEAARLLRDAGNLSDYDYVQQLAFAEESRLAVVAAENDALQARERLVVELGLWGPAAALAPPARFADPPADELDLAQLERRAVERSLDLGVVRRRIDAAGSQLGLARAVGLVPEIALGATVVREEGPVTVGPAGSITLPLLNQNQGEVRVRDAELRRAQAEYVSTAVRVRSATRAARAQLLYARQRAGFYRDVLLPLRQRALEQSMLQYNAMQLGVFQLLQTRRAQVETARGSIAALRDYWTARAALARVLAGRGAMSSAVGASDGDPEPAAPLDTAAVQGGAGE